VDPLSSSGADRRDDLGLGLPGRPPDFSDEKGVGAADLELGRLPIDEAEKS
jgi:hypothetical protein